jgi:hypothetical protein
MGVTGTLISMETPALSRGYSGPDVTLTAHLHVMSRIRMSGAIVLRPLHGLKHRQGKFTFYL